MAEERERNSHEHGDYNFIIGMELFARKYAMNKTNIIREEESV
jgi:hypothetical protein